MEKNEKKNFYIPKVEEETLSGGSGVPLDHFVSSVSGYNNKDTISFHHVKGGNASRYDAFRSLEERQASDSSNLTPDKKYDPNRVPSYLRREEPAINRNNIDFLMDEKPDEKTLYNQNRERYRKYSEIKNYGEEKEVTQSVVNQESPNPRKNYIKPTRNERSTLVITNNRERNYQRQEQYNEPYYQNRPQYNEPQYNYQDRGFERRDNYQPQNPNYQERGYERRDNYPPQNPNYQDNYQNRGYERRDNYQPQNPNYQDNYQNRSYERRDNYPPQSQNYQDDYQNRGYERRDENYPQRNDAQKNYQDNSREVFRPTNDRFTNVDNRRNDYEKDYRDQNRNEYGREDVNVGKEKRPSFITLEDEKDNYYSDISIGVSEEKEIEGLDEYKGEVTPRDFGEARPKRMVRRHKYVRPSLDILKKSGTNVYVGDETTEFQKTAINSTLEEFNIGGRVVSEVKGPTVTQFEVKLDPGIKVNKVEGITRNLQMNLASNYIRMEAPIPGRNTIGIEVPNQKKSIVTLGDLLDNPKYLNDGKPLNIVLGRGVSGEARYADIREMPHALVAGATGSGKTICIYSIIMSIIYKARPDEVKLMLIDPKRNELIFFENIPHLACPIIDEPKVATSALKWAVDEMERRYELFKPARSRTIDDYNAYISEYGSDSEKLPYIVIIIDEFAELMTTAGSSFEVNVQRICQKARSAGIHLIVATQRPSVEVIKGTIKANIQTRIALYVKSPTDSITILDHVGAEKLLGKGDMLLSDGGNDVRVQGAFVDMDEINAAVDSISTDHIDYMFTLDELEQVDDDGSFGGENGDQVDDMLVEIARFVVKNQIASMNQMIRMFNIGYNRIDTIMDNLQNMGIVSSAIQGKPRSVLISNEDDLEDILRSNKLI